MPSWPVYKFMILAQPHHFTAEETEAERGVMAPGRRAGRAWPQVPATSQRGCSCLHHVPVAGVPVSTRVRADAIGPEDGAFG